MGSFHEFVEAQPNPFQSTITLDVLMEANETAFIQIFDFNGKLISTTEMQGVKGMNALTLDTKEWATGTYFCRVFNESKSQALKLFKF